jgi:beta-galactosidase
MKLMIKKCLVVLFPLSSLFGTVAYAQARTDVVLNAKWKFMRSNVSEAAEAKYDDSQWESISLPHTWNALDGQDGGNDYYRGTGWYRKTFVIEAKQNGKVFYLKFDGAASSTEVFVNGKSVGTHKGNFGAFCFDITPVVTIGGKNVLAVRVNNAKDSTISPLRGDFTIFGGIYRSVRLLTLNKLSISPLDYASPGVYIKQLLVNEESAEIEITTRLQNRNDVVKSPILRYSILDHNGKTVQKAESINEIAANSKADAIQKLSLTKPRLWNGRRDAYLYQVVVELVDGKKIADRVVQPLGLRSFAVDAEKGFFLNGQPYRLNGVNRHQDRENMGWAITEKEHKEDFKLIEEIGANAIRLAHYQHAQEFYDLCDRGGMIVWAELALVDDIHPTPAFEINCREQLTELIKQNYNHPSIVFWSLQNELIPDSNPKFYSDAVHRLDTLAKQLDPTRLTTVASRSKYDGDDGINTATDVIGYNVYRGWYEGKPENFAKYADTLHQRFPKQKIGISEYGAGASVNQHEYPAKKPPTKGKWHPEEWQAVLHEVTWKAMAERPFLWGTFVWNMFDFGSDGRSEGEHHGQNDKGLVSYDRKVKKDAFYWYKANWNPEPMAYITSRRYTPRSTGVTEFKVYSNCESVELFVNGKTLGAKNAGDRIILWSGIDLQEGNNHVIAVGTAGGKKYKDECMVIGVKAMKQISEQ